MTDAHGFRATWRERLGAVLLLVAALAAPLAAQPPSSPGSQITPGEPAELRIWNRTIATLRANIGATAPDERVARAEARVESLSDAELDNTPRAIPARVGDLEGLIVYIGTAQIFTILPEDLDPEAGETLQSAGAAAEQHLTEALAARAEQRRLPVLVRGLAVSTIATLLFALVVLGLVRTQRWLQPRLAAAAERRGGAAVRQVRDYVAVVVRRAAQILAWGVGLIAADLWLTYVLNQFPYTQPWGRALGSGLRRVVVDLGVAIVGSLPDLFTVAVILLIARVVVRLLHGLFRGVEQGRLTLPGIQQETAEATRRISTVLVWLFAITIAYPYIPGSETDAFRGVSVFVGLMLSLGSAGLVNQVMSGLVVVYARAIRPGEYVKLGDVEGVVTEVGLLSTKVTTPRKEEVTVPNAVMITQATTNYSRLADRDGGMLTTAVTIGYDAPWRQVHALLCQAAERTASVRRDPPPRVMQRSLQDFYIEYVLLVHVDRPELRLLVLSDLHANIQDAFNAAGVQIMSPHFVAQPDAAVTVPKDKWEPPV